MLLPWVTPATSALLVCFVIVALFASSISHYSTRPIVTGLFVAAMLTLIVGLILFLREVYIAIGTFEIGLPAEARGEPTDRRMHAAQRQK